MADMTFADAVAALQEHEATVGADVLAAIRKRDGRSPEDRREAAKLAAETAKMILTVDVAGLVAVGTFVQFARNGGLPWSSLTIILFGIAALAGVVATGAGFTAITHIYKRADGRTHPDEMPWSTEASREMLNLQAFTSLLALGCLLAGIVLWASTPAQHALKVTTSVRKLDFAAAEPLTLTGQWTELRLEGASKSTLIIGKDEVATIACR